MTTLQGSYTPLHNGSNGSNVSQQALLNATSRMSFTIIDLVVVKDIQDDFQINVLIPASARVVLPTDGVRWNDVRGQTSSNARLGPILQTGITSTLPLGALLGTILEFGGSERASSVAMWRSSQDRRHLLRQLSAITGSNSSYFQSKAVAGDATSLAITFTPTMKILKGEFVVLDLPGFTGDQKNGVALAFSQTTKSPVNFTWTNSTMQLEFEISADILPGTSVTILVETACNLPIEGVPARSKSIRIATNAFDGPVHPTAFKVIQPVGAFVRSPRIEFDCVMEGLGTSIYLTFTPTMPIAPTEFVQLDLQGFSLPEEFNRFTSVTSNPQGVITFAEVINVDAAWQGVTLVFEVQAHLGEGAEVTLKISKQAGLMLPKENISPRNVSLQLTTDAIEGPVYFQNLGTFLTSPRVSWDFGRASVAGELLDFVFSFTYQSTLLAGEVITLHLPPGFSGDNSKSFDVETDPPGLVSTVLWTLADSRISMLLARRLEEDVEMKIEFYGSRSSIKLPAMGVSPETKPEFTISTNAIAEQYLRPASTTYPRWALS